MQNNAGSSLKEKLKQKAEKEGSELAEQMLNREERPLSEPEIQAVNRGEEKIEKAKTKADKITDPKITFSIYISSSIDKRYEEFVYQKKKEAVMGGNKIPTKNALIIEAMEKQMKPEGGNK